VLRILGHQSRIVNGKFMNNRPSVRRQSDFICYDQVFNHLPNCRFAYRTCRRLAYADRDIYPIYNSNCACSGAEMVPLATRSADFTRSLKLPGTPTDTARCGCLRTASSLKQKQCTRLA
jgi:hypothetical protein